MDNALTFAARHVRIGIRNFFAPLILVSRGVKFVSREYWKLVNAD